MKAGARATTPPASRCGAPRARSCSARRSLRVRRRVSQRHRNPLDLARTPGGSVQRLCRRSRRLHGSHRVRHADGRICSEARLVLRPRRVQADVRRLQSRRPALCGRKFDTIGLISRTVETRPIATTCCAGRLPRCSRRSRSPRAWASAAHTCGTSRRPRRMPAWRGLRRSSKPPA